MGKTSKNASKKTRSQTKNTVASASAKVPAEKKVYTFVALSNGAVTKFDTKKTASVYLKCFSAMVTSKIVFPTKKAMDKHVHVALVPPTPPSVARSPSQSPGTPLSPAEHARARLVAETIKHRAPSNRVEISFFTNPLCAAALIFIQFLEASGKHMWFMKANFLLQTMIPVIESDKADADVTVNAALTTCSQGKVRDLTAGPDVVKCDVSKKRDSRVGETVSYPQWIAYTSVAIDHNNITTK